MNHIWYLRRLHLLIKKYCCRKNHLKHLERAVDESFFFNLTKKTVDKIEQVIRNAGRFSMLWDKGSAGPRHVQLICFHTTSFICFYFILFVT